MRKLLLAVAGAAAILLTGGLTDRSEAMTLANQAGMRAAIDETRGVDQVRFVCTHFWNGRYHRRELCFWVRGNHRHHHHRHHRHWR